MEKVRWKMCLKSEIENPCLPTGRRNPKSKTPPFTTLFWGGAEIKKAAENYKFDNQGVGFYRKIPPFTTRVAKKGGDVLRK